MEQIEVVVKGTKTIEEFKHKRGFILSFFCSEKVYIYTSRFTPDFLQE